MNAGLVAGLVVFPAVFSSLFAAGGQDNQYSDNLDSAGQDIEEARSRVMDLKSFYSSDEQKKRYSHSYQNMRHIYHAPVPFSYLKSPDGIPVHLLPEFCWIGPSVMPDKYIRSIK